MNGILRAGGHPIHRVRSKPRIDDDDAPPRTDQVPLIERYTNLATAMHRTVIVPRGDRYLWGCACGAFGLTPPGGQARAQLVAQQHVVTEAEAMYEKLEGHPVVPFTEE